jgi:pSer/pThr/pTyr-binding forkhead associated (FHA) protein
MTDLYIYPKKKDSYCFPLEQQKISIGRAPDNDIYIPDPFLSSHHTLIYPSGTKFMVRDNNSKNGTFVNGKQITGERELQKGDEILFGSTRIIFDQERPLNADS